MTITRLTGYPLSIDPTSPSIDARLEDGDRQTFKQFRRVVADATQLPFTRTICEAHLFGDGETLAVCDYVLVYSNVGQLTRVLNRTRAGLDVIDVPPETLGIREMFASIRHTFQDEHARRRYLSLLSKMHEAVRDGRNPSPRDAAELIMILAQSPTPVRSVYVVATDADTA